MKPSKWRGDEEKNTQFNVILEKAKQTNTNEDKKKVFHIFFIFFLFLCVHELYKLSMKWAYETFRDIEQKDEAYGTDVGMQQKKKTFNFRALR